MSGLKIETGGYTIVELLTSIVIGALFFAAVSTMITNNSRISHKARDIAVANSFTENKIEGLRSAGYLSLTNGTTDIASELPSELNPPRTGSQLTISNTPGTTSIKKIDITIKYNELGSMRTYNYTTYIGELGVGQY